MSDEDTGVRKKLHPWRNGLDTDEKHVGSMRALRKRALRKRALNAAMSTLEQRVLQQMGDPNSELRRSLREGLE